MRPDRLTTMPDLDQLVQLEEAMWRSETRGDRGWMDRHLAPEFREFGRSGRRYTRDETIAIDVGEIDAVLPLADLEIRELSANLALVTYRSEVAGETANRSSIWRWSGSGWRMEFHQGTPTQLTGAGGP